MNRGAIRVYETGNIKIKKWNRDRALVDDMGVSWNLSEAKLESDDSRILKRLPSHRAFWFGWHAAFPNTTLIH